MAEAEGVQVDEDGFKKAMQEQKQRSKVRACAGICANASQFFVGCSVLRTAKCC